MNNQVEQQPISVPEESTEQLSLWKGGHGLPVTFWVWGVLGSIFLGFVIAAAINISKSAANFIVCALVFESYTAFITLAVFRAALRTKADGLWKIVAQIFMLGWFGLVSFVFVFLMGTMLSPYPNH